MKILSQKQKGEVTVTVVAVEKPILIAKPTKNILKNQLKSSKKSLLRRFLSKIKNK